MSGADRTHPGSGGRNPERVLLRPCQHVFLLFSIIFMLIAAPLPVSAGAPDMEWSVTGGRWSEGVSVAADNDGYVAAGYQGQNGFSYCKTYLVKTDKSGHVLWNRTYSPNSSALSIISIGDGYVFTGWIRSDNAQKLYLVKTDPEGNPVWEKAIGDHPANSGYSVARTRDGYIVAGGTVSDNDNVDILLVKTDLNGNPIWSKIYAGPKYEVGYSVATVPGGYLVAGYAGPDNSSVEGRRLFLLKTDAEGNQVWLKAYGDYFYQGMASVAAVKDGYVLVGSREVDLCRYAYLVKTDLNGEVLWDKNYSGNRNAEGYFVAAVDDDFIIVGSTTGNISEGDVGSNVFIVRMDRNGNLVWNNSFGTHGMEIGRSVIEDNGAYIVTGTTDSLSFGDIQLYILKTRRESNAKPAPFVGMEALGAIGLGIVLYTLSRRE